MVLACGLSLIMLGLGGIGSLINMSYGLDATIHNTQWVTAHFHLIYGGAIVIMYFAIAYRALAETYRAASFFALLHFPCDFQAGKKVSFPQKKRIRVR